MSIKFRNPIIKVEDKTNVEVVDENGNVVEEQEGSVMKKHGKKVVIGACLGLAALIGGICLAKRRKRNQEEDVEVVDDYDFDDDYEPEDQVDDSEEDYNETTD